MVVIFEGSHIADSGTGTVSSLQLDLSLANGAVGRLAMAISEFSASAAVISNNRAGWTALPQINVATTLSSRVFYKILDATDIANNTFTLSIPSTTRCAIACGVWSGVDPTTPLDAVVPNPATTSEATNDQTNPFLGIDPVAFAYIVALQANNMAAGGTKTDWPAGWTKLFGVVSSQTTLRRAGVSCGAYNGNPTDQAVAGGNTTPDQLAHSATSTFALRPAAVAPASSGRFFPFI